ncbi:hypothetical protein BTVI_95993 [Pitangus sulphuratus]|nr:hypothetical protein BTVI_95993 [Pitangus sulphuratus]
MLQVSAVQTSKDLMESSNDHDHETTPESTPTVTPEKSLLIWKAGKDNGEERLIPQGIRGWQEISRNRLELERSWLNNPNHLSLSADFYVPTLFTFNNFSDYMMIMNPLKRPLIVEGHPKLQKFAFTPQVLPSSFQALNQTCLHHLE